VAVSSGNSGDVPGDSVGALGVRDVLIMAVGEAEVELIGAALSERFSREQLEKTTRAHIIPTEEETSRCMRIYEL